MLLRMDWRHGQGEYDSGIFALVLLTWSTIFTADCYFDGSEGRSALVYLLLYHGGFLT
jgi:hypothetical protein